MNMNKNHKLKKEAEEKLLKYLNENIEININTEQEHNKKNE